MNDRLTKWEGRDENGPRAVFAKEGRFPELMQEALRKLAELEDAEEQPEVHTILYDKEELYENCTVQVLTNTVTGDVSVGWWENDDDLPPSSTSYEELFGEEESD